MSLFEIGVSGLRAQQAALNTTGQNITNASSPGYSRQRVLLQADQAGSIGNGFDLTRVQIEGIERITDQLAVSQLRSDQSLLSEMTVLTEQIEQVDNALFGTSAGLRDAFSAFFSAIDAANANPSASTERSLVLERGDQLLGQLARVQESFVSQRQDLNTALATTTEEISGFGQALADLNVQIGVARGTGIIGADNQLLDQRDELLRQLSERVGVRAIINDQEQVNVFVGKGQPLVLGADASRLTVDARGEVLLNSPGLELEPIEINQSITGGELGGLLAFEQDVLRPTEQRLGRLALGFTQAFNEQHREGVNLYGEAGQSFFSDLNDPNLLSTRVSRVDRLTTRPAQMTLQVDDLGQVPLSDYTLSIADDLDGGFRLERESDGALLVSGRVESLFQPLSFDGMTLKTDVEALAPGQVYRLSPFGGAASQLSVLLSDGQELALAERSSVTPSAANAGDGRVVARETLEAGDRAGVESTSLPDDLLVRFLAEDRYEILDNSDPAAPQALDPPLRGLPFSAGQTSPLVNVTPGVSRLESTTLQVGEPQPSVVTLDPAARGLNGYDAQTLQFFDTSGTAESLLDSVTLTANASARSSAEQLAVLPGVRASAYTELQIADIEASLADGAPEILVNGVSLGRVGDLDAFVGAVNASADLASAGIKARLEDGQAVVASIYGDDLTLAVRGAPESVVEVVTDRGQRERLVGQGVGDPPALIGTSDIRGPVTFSAGSDFSVFVNQSNGPGATVTLNGSFASAADLVFDLQSQLDDVLGPAVVEVGLNPGGQIRFVGSDVGSSATLNVAPSSALAGFLGLPASSASGNERYAATTVGGVLSLELDPDTRMRSVGSGLFAAEPETTAPRLPLELRFEGVAQAGDSFAVSLNADNPLGNGIGLELSELQRRGIIGIEGVTIDEALAETVEFVGIRGSKASSDASAAEVLVEQSNARVQAVSGVNLDEEAANLIRFEQAYNASAQVISVARDLFTSLLNAIA